MIEYRVPKKGVCMFDFKFNKLDQTTQGIIIFVLGVVLLLYALNIFQRWFNVIFIITAIVLIAIGSMKLELPEKIRKFVRK
jgi:hypothetical protein